MQTETVLLILLAALAAMAIVLFQYFYKVSKRGKLYAILSFMRFISLFGIFVLLINPKFSRSKFTLEKPNLLVLVDNSSSMKLSDGKTTIDSVLNLIKSSSAITDRFNLEQYSFGSTLNDSDSLSFEEKNTNITKALSTANDIYANTQGAIVVLTDGNQTLGQDYEFYSTKNRFPIYPISIGDTTKYEDLRISQVNANTYAFLKNKYPVEIYVAYEGKGSVATSLRITLEGKTVFRENITLSSMANAKAINALLDAKSVGVKTLKVALEPLKNERNVANNQKDIAIEVIDERTNIAIITDVLHPDIGALKNSIESNEQRSVSIKRTNVDTKDLEPFDLLVLYQPTRAFKNVYEYLGQKKTNIFTITGPKTDWNFLNAVQNSFTKNSYHQAEEVFPTLNFGFSTFNIAEFSIENFPPLETNLGEVIINKKNEVLLGQRIKGVDLQEPLLAVMGNDREKEAVLFGENLWKWRIQSYRSIQDFQNFDDFIGKIVLYLSSNKPKSRFSIEYKPVYTGSNEAKITALYFDETFVFDNNATIVLHLKTKGSIESEEIPMLLKEGYYEADLSNLSSGEYDFTIMVKEENLSKSGSFTILEFDIEEQFLSSDYQKLGRLASNTGGKLFFPFETTDLIQEITEDNRFLPTQKSKENVVSLIDFRLVLAIIVSTFAVEWFIRKYNGLI